MQREREREIKACWRHSHLLKMRFGKIITIHEAENNICKCFPYVIVSHSFSFSSTANRTFIQCERVRIPYSHSQLLARKKHTHTFVCDVFLWIHGKWHKFAMSYIAIQCFVVGINVAIQNCSVGL